MTNISNKSFDLEERTAKFGENVILFCKSIPESNINKPLINQLARSSTSVGANYCEANGGSTKKILSTKYIFAKKRQRKQNTGFV